MNPLRRKPAIYYCGQAFFPLIISLNAILRITSTKGSDIRGRKEINIKPRWTDFMDDETLIEARGCRNDCHHGYQRNVAKLKWYEKI